MTDLAADWVDGTCPSPAPWDEPWVRALKITKPMFVILYDTAVQGGGYVSRADCLRLYPGGQVRLILQGLLNRDLIDSDLALTEAGRTATLRALASVRLAYPASPGRGDGPDGGAA